jgi:hypothetical protein
MLSGVFYASSDDNTPAFPGGLLREQWDNKYLDLFTFETIKL